MMSESVTTLDPVDWAELRVLGHRMLDDAFDDIEGIREHAVWQKMPDAVRVAWAEPLPREGEPPGDTYVAFRALDHVIRAVIEAGSRRCTPLS